MDYRVAGPAGQGNCYGDFEMASLAARLKTRAAGLPLRVSFRGKNEFLVGENTAWTAGREAENDVCAFYGSIVFIAHLDYRQRDVARLYVVDGAIPL